MANQVGIVKQVVGSAVAVDALGNQRVINSGDEIFLGEVIKTLTDVSKVSITTNDGKDITILGRDILNVDQSVIESNSFGGDAIADATALQQAILSGTDLANLEETAAGGGDAGGAGGTARLNDSFFASSGHYSNVEATTISLGESSFDSLSPVSTVSGAGSIAEGSATAIQLTTPVLVSIDGKNPSEPTNDTTPTIKVRVDDNAKPKLVDNDGNDIPATYTENNDGTWDITPTDPIDPENTNVVATDDSGNTSDPISVNPIIDTDVPEVAITEVTPVDTDEVADGKPNKAIVTGISDEPNAKVVITNADGRVIGEGVTDEKGSFTIETTEPVQPGEEVTAIVTDKAGNEGKDTKEAGDMKFDDNIDPVVTINEVTPVDTDEVADGKPNKAIVTGISDEPNAKVVITNADGRVIGEGVTDEKGSFTIETTEPVQPGEEVTAIVTDKAGNEGKDTSKVPAVEAPDIPEITDVYGNDKNIGTNGLTNDSTPRIVGNAKAGSVVKIYDGDQVVGEAKTDSTGKFELTLDKPLKDGLHELKADATIGYKTSAKSEAYTITTDTDEVATASVETKLTYSNDIPAAIADGKVYRVNYNKTGTESGRGKATIEEVEHAQISKEVHEGYTFKSSKLWYCTDNHTAKTDRLSYNNHETNSKYTNSLKKFLSPDTETVKMEEWKDKSGKLVTGENDSTINKFDVWTLIKVEGYVYMKAGSYVLSTVGSNDDIHLKQYVNDLFKMKITDVEGKNLSTDATVAVDYINGKKETTFKITEDGFYKLNVSYADSWYGLKDNIAYEQTASLRPSFKYTDLDDKTSSKEYTIGNSEVARYFDPAKLPAGVKLEDVKVVYGDEAYAASEDRVVFDLKSGSLKYAVGYTTDIEVNITDTDGTALAADTLVKLTYDGKTYDLKTDSNGNVKHSFHTDMAVTDKPNTKFEFDVKATDKAGNEIDQHFIVDTSNGNVQHTWNDKSNDLNFKTGAGDDTLTTGSGNDFIDAGEGKDTIKAGAGNDRVVFDANDKLVDGGEGTDTLVIKQESIDFSQISDLKTKVNSFEIIDMRGEEAKSITIKAQDVLDITDSADTILKIDGDAGDKVTKGDWTKSENQDKGDIGYTVYESTAGNQTVYIQIDDKITVE